MLIWGDDNERRWDRLRRALENPARNAQEEVWQAEADQLCDVLDRIIQGWEAEANR